MRTNVMLNAISALEAQMEVMANQMNAVKAQIDAIKGMLSESSVKEESVVVEQKPVVVKQKAEQLPNPPAEVNLPQDVVEELYPETTQVVENQIPSTIKVVGKVPTKKVKYLKVLMEPEDIIHANEVLVNTNSSEWCHGKVDYFNLRLVSREPLPGYKHPFIESRRMLMEIECFDAEGTIIGIHEFTRDSLGKELVMYLLSRDANFCGVNRSEYKVYTTQMLCNSIDGKKALKAAKKAWKASQK